MNNKGVSAVVWVILMVAITVAIAGTVYVYVSNMIDAESYTYEGKIDFISEREYKTLHTEDEYYFSMMSLNDEDYAILLMGYTHNCTIGFLYYTNYENINIIESGTIFILDCCEGLND